MSVAPPAPAPAHLASHSLSALIKLELERIVQVCEIVTPPPCFWLLPALGSLALDISLNDVVMSWNSVHTLFMWLPTHREGVVPLLFYIGRRAQGLECLKHPYP